MKAYYLQILIWFMGIFSISHTASAQPEMMRFQQLDSLQASVPKPVVVFIYTNWCKHCAAMKQTTFKNKEVKQLLNESFYFVMLNAEEQSDITWSGYTFQFKTTGNNTGIHELAAQLGSVNGESSYPVLTFLNPRFEITYQFKGYLSAAALKKILVTVKDASESFQ